MIRQMVILKIQRAIFPPYRPVGVMVGYFDRDGTLQSSHLLSASLFEPDISEGQEINFKKESPTLQVMEMASTNPQ